SPMAGVTARAMPVPMAAQQPLARRSLVMCCAMPPRHSPGRPSYRSCSQGRSRRLTNGKFSGYLLLLGRAPRRLSFRIVFDGAPGARLATFSAPSGARVRMFKAVGFGGRLGGSRQSAAGRCAFSRICFRQRTFTRRLKSRAAAGLIGKRSRLRLRCRGTTAAPLRRWPRCIQLSLPVSQFACFGAALFDRRLQAFDPEAELRRRPAEYATRPNQFERRKLPPSLIAVDNRARDEVRAHRRRIEAVTAETAGQPDAGTEFADLRHAMHRDPQRAGPS